MKKFIALLNLTMISSLFVSNIALAGTWSIHSDLWEQYTCDHPGSAYWTDHSELHYEEVCK